MPLIAAWRWREDTFRDDGDREMLLATLAETVEKTGWRVHAWVWMRNHYHLLVDARGESGERDDVISNDVHDPVQCAAPIAGPSLWRAL